MELRVPPPLIALITAALMWSVSALVPFANFVVPARTVFAIACAAIGVSVAATGVLTFKRARTSLDPFRPSKATSLVAAGIFGFTRNPMYLSLLCALTGWAVFLSNAAAFVLLPGFVFYINRFQIVPEEKVLSSLFGTEFAEYTSRVRRWL